MKKLILVVIGCLFFTNAQAEPTLQETTDFIEKNVNRYAEKVVRNAENHTNTTTIAFANCDVTIIQVMTLEDEESIKTVSTFNLGAIKDVDISDITMQEFQGIIYLVLHTINDNKLIKENRYNTEGRDHVNYNNRAAICMPAGQIDMAHRVNKAFLHAIKKCEQNDPF